MKWVPSCETVSTSWLPPLAERVDGVVVLVEVEVAAGQRAGAGEPHPVVGRVGAPGAVGRPGRAAVGAHAVGDVGQALEVGEVQGVAGVQVQVGVAAADARRRLARADVARA